jgi:hypothetical protein
MNIKTQIKRSFICAVFSILLAWLCRVIDIPEAAAGALGAAFICLFLCAVFALKMCIEKRKGKNSRL